MDLPQAISNGKKSPFCKKFRSSYYVLMKIIEDDDL